MIQSLGVNDKMFYTFLLVKEYYNKIVPLDCEFTYYAKGIGMIRAGIFENGKNTSILDLFRYEIKEPYSSCLTSVALYPICFNVLVSIIFSVRFPWVVLKYCSRLNASSFKIKNSQ
jgi:hypothetical protein